MKSIIKREKNCRKKRPKTSQTLKGKEFRIFHGLYQQEAFASRVAELYESTFRPLLKALCDTGIETYANQIAEAAALSEFRWKMGHNPEESQLIRNFLLERIEFLDAYWIKKETFYHVKIHSKIDGSEGEFAVRPGDQLPYMPGLDLESGSLGWYIAETGEPFDVTQPIQGDMSLLIKKIA